MIRLWSDTHYILTSCVNDLSQDDSRHNDLHDPIQIACYSILFLLFFKFFFQLDDLVQQAVIFYVKILQITLQLIDLLSINTTIIEIGGEVSDQSCYQ